MIATVLIAAIMSAVLLSGRLAAFGRRTLCFSHLQALPAKPASEIAASVLLFTKL